MNHQSTLPGNPDSRQSRRAAIGYMLVALTSIAFYVGPILLMALCLHLGWYAEPTA